MPSSQAYKSSLVTFGRHTPRTLRQQLLCQLALQYVGIKEGHEILPTQPEDPRPSISRFHGALLFVDISGFTALSLRLKVEDLKNHINEYFATMLNIVDKWDGDVIKFAGDALYVIWKTDLSMIQSEDEDTLPARLNKFYSKDFLDSKYGQKAIRSCLEKATACGLEIGKTCCNHEVQLDPPVVEAPPSSSGIMSKILPKWARLPAATGKVAPENENVAYLNVHAGVSFGLMAGVDIGALDRWEYFLIGNPLHRVAEAEEEAAKGDIVICPEGHALLHAGEDDSIAETINTSSKLSSKLFGKATSTAGKANVELPCGCTRTPKGFFKITKVDAGSPRHKPSGLKLKRARSKTRLDEPSTNQSSAENVQNFRIYEDCCVEIEKLYGMLQSILKTEVQAFLNRSDMLARAQQKLTVGTADGVPSSCAVLAATPKAKEKFILDIMSNELRKQVFDWLQYCVLEDIVKHVHDVARDDYFYEPKPRSTAFKTFLENMLKGATGKPNVRASVIKSPTMDDNDDDTDNSPSPPPTKMMLKNKNPSLNGNQFTALVKKASSKYLVQDSVLTAEIRNVMVMFIKIVGLELEVMVDNSGGESSSTHIPGNIHHAIMSFSRSSFRASGGTGTPDNGVRRSGGNLRGSVMGNSRAMAKGQSIAGVFDFIDRTANEVAADTLMLSRVQRCMEALCEVFTETGGQMRQFIVDDKGTVCIGTFGLRGSVGVDNAAAALETAKKIVIRLQALDLTASIGITSGKAYCGLVGSPSRHEYAVMGPSTNLSARLMCKAPPFGVICDIETKNRDRTHGFEPLNEVNAKGYAHPVMTFKPIFEDIVQHLRANTDSQVYAALSPLSAGGGSKRINVLRSSTDWYIGNLAKSQSRNFRGSFESVHGPLSVNLSGKGSTRNKLQKSPSNAALFQKRRGSVIVAGTDKEEVLKQSTRKHKLHGRHEELRQILTFLFPNASASFTSLQDNSVASINTGGGLSAGSSVMGINTNSSANGAEIDAMSESRMVVISGGEGTGKSALADSVAHQIFVASKHNPVFRIFTFRNRPSSLEMHIPFHGVKPILQDLLAKVASLPSQSKTPRAGGRPNLVKESSLRKVKLSLKDTIFSGLSMVFASLPTEMQDLRCLLSLASIIPQEEGMNMGIGMSMDEEKRMQATIDLIVAMIGLFPQITKSSVLLLIEEMQSLDYPSRLILQKIFKESRGIFILATHRASPSSFNAEGGDNLNNTLTEFDLTNVHAFTGTLTATPATPASHTKSLLESYITSSNFKLVDLLPLSADATRSLIVDTLPDSLLYKINDAFIDKIVEASGGHPLYAFELTRSVAEKLKESSTENDVSTILTEMEVGVTSNRIEEMICYRFDQLDTSVQMVLKVAAVACSHGAPFTLDMLIYALIGGEGEGEGDFDDYSGAGSSDGDSGSAKMMGGGFASPGAVNAYDMSSESAREVLEAILVRGEFIQICQVSEDLDEVPDLESPSRLPPPINVSGDLLTPHTLLEFKIVLEQITIYNLLVDDQREVFHERVASYYHQKVATLNDTATYNQVLYLATLIEEAYHWQQGACYIPAMKAHYELAQEYREMKDSHACNMALQTAYSMFMSLRSEHNVPAYVLCTKKELKQTFEQSTTEYAGPQIIGGAGDDGSKASESVASIWSLETLYSMFSGEIDDLRVAINIHQQLVLNELASFENPKYILPVAEEGIKIMCAVRKPHILANSAVFSSLMAINASNSKNADKSFKGGGSMRAFGGSFKKAASNFYLEDFESFAPPLYFTYALASCMIEGSHMPHDPLFHSASHLGKGKTTLDELMKILTAGSMADKRYLMAQTQCQLLMFQLNSAKMSIATVEHLVSSILTNYLPVPSNLLEAESYLGIDIAGLTFAFVGQFYILRGEIAKGRKYLAQGIEAVRNMTLPSSAAFAVPPLIASLHLIKDYDRALNLLDDYDNLFGIPHIYQPNSSLTSLFSEKSSLHRRLTRSVSIASSVQAAQQLPTIGLRPHFIQKLRVWLMCDRNQSSRSLDLTERILGFSQLTSRMQQQVMKDIISPQALDGNFWPDFLLFCGLSLPAITAMVFSCHTVMLQGSKLFNNNTLRLSLEDYVKQSAEEHHIQTGFASIVAKLYYHQANIKLTSVVKALGVNVNHILVPAKLDEQLLEAIHKHFKVQLPFAAALLGSLAMQVTANKEIRKSVVGMQKVALDTIMQAQEKNEDNNEHDKGLELKDGKQLWLQRRRLV